MLDVCMIIPQILVASACVSGIASILKLHLWQKGVSFRTGSLVIRHSVGKPGGVTSMACEMQEGRPDVETPLNCHFPSASNVG